MKDFVFLFFIFLLLLAIEGTFNYISGFWSLFWIVPEIIFDFLFIGFIGFLALADSRANNAEVRN